MKHIYSGNIESLSSLVDRINSGQKFRLFPSNEITNAQLKSDKLQINGMLCKGIGQIDKQKDNLTIDLKVRLKRQFTFSGIIVLLLLSGFIWGENVTINGDTDPSIWKRIGFVSIGLAFFSILVLILRKARSDFKKKIIELVE